MGQYYYFHHENGAKNELHGVPSNFGLPWAARHVEDSDFVEIAKKNNWPSGKITARGDYGNNITYNYISNDISSKRPKRAAAIKAIETIRKIVANKKDNACIKSIEMKAPLPSPVKKQKDKVKNEIALQTEDVMHIPDKSDRFALDLNPIFATYDEFVGCIETESVKNLLNASNINSLNETYEMSVRIKIGFKKLDQLSKDEKMKIIAYLNNSIKNE